MSSTPAAPPKLIAALHGRAKGASSACDDLEAYQAKLRPPVHTTFRGFDVYSIGPPSSGGIVLCQMLNILERYDLPRTAASPRRHCTASPRRCAAASSRGPTSSPTPTSSTIPVAELTSKAYADELARSIGERATPSRRARPVPDPARRKRPHDPSFVY